MNDFRAIIFDLDGTLANSLMDIADAMNRTLLQLGYPIHNYDAYKYFVGNGLKNLVFNCLPEGHRDEKHVLQSLSIMTEEYGKTYVDKTRLYTGISELLDKLTSKNIKMAVLSNKADELTQKICKTLLSRWKFELILGANEQFPRKPAPDSALYIANKMEVLPENILYVGDTNVDMQTANAAGMYAIGVTWGFRTRLELEENGAKMIINNPLELVTNFQYHKDGMD